MIDDRLLRRRVIVAAENLDLQRELDQLRGQLQTTRAELAVEQGRREAVEEELQDREMELEQEQEERELLEHRLEVRDNDDAYQGFIRRAQQLGLFPEDPEERQRREEKEEKEYLAKAKKDFLMVYDFLYMILLLLISIFLPRGSSGKYLSWGVMGKNIYRTLHDFGPDYGENAPLADWYSIYIFIYSVVFILAWMVIMAILDYLWWGAVDLVVYTCFWTLDRAWSFCLMLYNYAEPTIRSEL